MTTEQMGQQLLYFDRYHWEMQGVEERAVRSVCDSFSDRFGCDWSDASIREFFDNPTLDCESVRIAYLQEARAVLATLEIAE